MSLKILYEDNHLVAVYKPAGVLVQADKSGDKCLMDYVKDYLKDKYNKPGSSMAPELKLILMASGSAFKYHIQNKIYGGMVSLNDQVSANPEMMEAYRQKAVSDKMNEHRVKNDKQLNELAEKTGCVLQN